MFFTKSYVFFGVRKTFAFSCLFFLPDWLKKSNGNQLKYFPIGRRGLYG